ncbi:MAG: uroporphyrinogen decarboxylase family protein [Candidatus Thorarchaeota archaeon]
MAAFPVISPFELLRQVLSGDLGERLPISLWKHHPYADRDPVSLAEAETSFHREFDHDLMKITFHGRYPVVDWGCVAVYDGRISGSTTCESCSVNSVSDWETLEPVDVNSGEFGKQLRAVELISRYAHNRVPTAATVFDPAMVADKLCCNRLLDYASEAPERLKIALQMITGVMVEFGRACLEIGCDGLFIASQHSTSSVSDAFFREFVLPYLSELISKLRSRTRMLLVHLHSVGPSDEVRLAEVSRIFGIDALNWDAQGSGPGLKEGKRISRRSVMGGIDQDGLLRTGTHDQVASGVISAIRNAGLRSLVVAPGCVIPIDVPSENIHSALSIVRSIDPYSKEWSPFE